MQKIKFKETKIGMIPEDWEVKKIGDLVKINENTVNKNYTELNIEYIDTSSVDGGFLVETQKLKIKEAPSRAKRILKDNDILISTVRPNLKHYFFVKKSKKNLVGSTGFVVISPSRINPEFLYYYLTTENYTNFLTAIADAHTSTYPSFNPDVIETSFCPYPEENEQSAIAKILSDLDFKIELNQQMNKTLEAIGQAIFKHWFINFEFPNEKGKPYKSSGGEMVDSELGKIPKGWKILELNDVIKFVKGKKPKELFDENIENTLPQILVENLNGVSPFFADKSNMAIVNEEEVIMVMDGASSGRVERGHKGILGSTLAKIECKNQLNNSFIYHFLKILQKEIKQNTTGTSIPHADKGRIEKYKTIIPEKSVLKEFEKISNQILYKIILDKQEIKSLSQIRDSLLPRLMSGKIRVPVEVRV